MGESPPRGAYRMNVRTTVSGLSPELKAEAKRLGINISRVTRQALRVEIERRKRNG